MKILIADDEVRQRQLLGLMLSKYDCAIVEAGTGLEAVTAAKRERPDLIIMDHHMPEMPGYEAIKEIRKDPAMGKVPFVMVTIDPHIQGRQEEEALEGCAYLPKPYSQEQLLSTISVAIGKTFPLIKQ
ncbi:MAG: response regulator [Elusimicrobia bacterium]|nr:response regulator [Elusimicrobiota bacterium]